MSLPYRGRFAPSPTGALHFGSLLAALGSWIRARQQAGVWLIRIEDLDPPREVRGAAESQLRTLEAFGLASDEPVWRQSERAEVYAQALDRMLDAGLAFECRCSRTDLIAQGGIHRRCTASEPGRRAAIRARLPFEAVGFEDELLGRYEQVLADQVGDIVLRRVDGWHAYQLAVVVDDAAQGITEVVRGSDLLDSTPRQIWLQRTLGLPTPRYLHLPLALDGFGRKLGKSLASLALDPDDPVPALRAAWSFLGQDPPLMREVAGRDAALQRAVEHFDWARVPRHSQSFPIASPV